MKENKIDIAKLIIENMPQDTELQFKIKFYIETHKNNCNNFIYKKYQQQIAYLNSTITALTADLGAEIVRNFVEKNMI